jgi:hypothetical protein
LSFGTVTQPAGCGIATARSFSVWAVIGSALTPFRKDSKGAALVDAAADVGDKTDR